MRATLAEADSALLCVAFVHERGLRLIEKEVDALLQRNGRARLLVTTTFDRAEGAALAVASGLGFEVRVLNPGRGTFHPKLYLGKRSTSTSAVIGSANLTGGLVTNVEIGVRLEGTRSDPPLRDAWEWGEARWRDARSELWQPLLAAEGAPREVFDADLYPLLRAAVDRNSVFTTLGGQPRRNQVLNLSPAELWVETDQSKQQGAGGQPIPAWMFNMAWQRLKNLGSLTNRQLLNDMRVHRSSAVCAILARLPGVSAAPGRHIELRWEPKR